MRAKFNPAPNDMIRLRGEDYTIQPHPSAVGQAFSAEASRATVYNLKSKGSAGYALKVFKRAYRSPDLLVSAQRLERFEHFDGMLAAQRSVLLSSDQAVQDYPDLEYAMLMRWIWGTTWYDLLLRASEQGCVFDLPTAFHHCTRFLAVINGLESAGVAHTDISPGNVMLMEHSADVQLLDLEDLYVPGISPPRDQNMGSTGYGHPSASGGKTTWCPEGDRYAAAILVSEMLLLAEPTLAVQASDTGFFGGDRTSQIGAKRYGQALPYLQTVAPEFSVLFTKAWNSTTLAACPRVAELHACLTRTRGAYIPGVRWTRQQGVPGGTVPAQGQAPWYPRMTTSLQSSTIAKTGLGFAWGGSKSTTLTSNPKMPLAGTGPNLPPGVRTSVLSTPPPQKSYQGVGGWLLFVILTITIFAPIAFLVLFQPYGDFQDQAIVLLVAQLAFCIYAGRKMWLVRQNATRTAKLYLLFVVICGVVNILFADNAIIPSPKKEELIGSASVYLFWRVVYSALVGLYLKKSKRVATTYGGP